MQRWSVVQRELMPELRSKVGPLTPRLEKVIHTLEWVRIEGFVESAWCGVGRSPHDRGALASAFVAKTVLGLPDQYLSLLAAADLASPYSSKRFCQRTAPEETPRRLARCSSRCR
jgi:hypothetical protein